MSLDSSRLTPARLATNPTWLRLVTHLQSPLLRNGYALVFNSVATSALGVLYWMLAANYYSADVVGINAALINTLLFLSQAAQLNLANGVNRFLPTAGERSNRFVFIVYAIILAAAPLVCLVYFAGLKSWAPMLDSVFADRKLVWGFVLATMAWCIFAMQDSVLIGMRQATWVPLENLIFAVAKIVLLVTVVLAMPGLGIFFSWVAPMMVLLLPVNWFIFRHLAPKHIAETRHHQEPLEVRTVAHYVGGDYLGSLVWTATIGLLPIIVLEQAGATENAYFSIAWTIANSLYLVSRNMGMSLISEASLDRSKLAVYSQRTLLQTFKLLVPITLFVVIAAPWILRLFGKEYSSEATNVLRLLALSALPAVITTIYVSVARVQRRMVAVFAVQAVLCAIVLLLSFVLLNRIGITGVGVAWLAGQTMVAIALLLGDLRQGVKDEMLLQIASRQRNRWSLWRSQQKLAQMQPLIDSILANLGRIHGGQHWHLQQVLPTLGDVTVALLGHRQGERAAILKFPFSAGSLRYSQFQQRTLTELHANDKLGEWLALVPKLLLAGEEKGQHYVVESMMPGVPMDKLLAQPALREDLLNQAVDAISTLHQRTACATVVDEDLLNEWVAKPIAQLQTLYVGKRAQDKVQALVQLGELLRHELLGKKVTVGWGHGDFAPCNILVSEDGSSVVGIVDWEQSQTSDLPAVDIAFLLLTMRMQIQNSELGGVVTELLTRGMWEKPEAEILQRSQILAQSLSPMQTQTQIASEALNVRILVLLTWLRHVSMTIDKSDRYRTHTIWRRNNVDPVLATIRMIAF